MDWSRDGFLDGPPGWHEEYGQQGDEYDVFNQHPHSEAHSPEADQDVYQAIAVVLKVFCLFAFYETGVL
jgi:hypothetical protein